MRDFSGGATTCFEGLENYCGLSSDGQGNNESRNIGSFKEHIERVFAIAIVVDGYRIF